MEEIYDIFVDEAGQTSYFNDPDCSPQPIVTLAGIITKNNDKLFDSEVTELLIEFNLPQNTEIHMKKIIDGDFPFNHLSDNKKKYLVEKFIKIGLRHCDYCHYNNDVKPFRKEHERKKLEERNLDPFLSIIHVFVTQVDIYMHYALSKKYNLFFDKSDDKRPARLIRDLKKNNGKNYYLRGINNDLTKIDSKDNRFIQLADVFCYFAVRNTLITTKTFTQKEPYLKHKTYIKKCFNLFKKKELPIVKLGLKEFMPGGFYFKDEIQIVFKDYSNRDFNHLKKMINTKSKEDVFDHTVNSFFIKKNEGLEELGNRLKGIYDLKKNTDKQYIYEIKCTFFYIYRDIFEDNNAEYQGFPEYKKLQNSINASLLEYKKKGIQFDQIPINIISVVLKFFEDEKIIPSASNIIQFKIDGEHQQIIKCFSKLYDLIKNKIYNLIDGFLKFSVNDVEKYKNKLIDTNKKFQIFLKQLNDIIDNELSIYCNDNKKVKKIAFYKNFHFVALLKNSRTSFNFISELNQKVLISLQYLHMNNKTIKNDFDDFVLLEERFISSISSIENMSNLVPCKKIFITVGTPM